VAARVQAARSLFDPTYIESSWITQSSLPFQPSGTPAQFKTNAIQLLPREQSLIDQYNPGTKIGISEYNYGAGNHISGGVAEADVLGVFGQQGVFSANWWPDGASPDNFTNSAFNLYLNYGFEPEIQSDEDRRVARHASGGHPAMAVRNGGARAPVLRRSHLASAKREAPSRSRLQSVSRTGGDSRGP
jgi:hypothetical protein